MFSHTVGCLIATELQVSVISGSHK